MNDEREKLEYIKNETKRLMKWEGEFMIRDYEDGDGFVVTGCDNKNAGTGAVVIIREGRVIIVNDW